MGLGEFFNNKKNKSNDKNKDDINERNTEDIEENVGNMDNNLFDNLDENVENDEYLNEDTRSSNNVGENIDESMSFFDLQKDLPPEVKKRVEKFFYGGLTKQNTMTFLMDDDFRRIEEITKLIFGIWRAFYTFLDLDSVKWLIDKYNTKIFMLLTTRRSLKGFSTLKGSDFAIREFFKGKEDKRNLMNDFLKR